MSTILGYMRTRTLLCLAVILAVCCLGLVVPCIAADEEEEKPILSEGTYSDDFSDPGSGWEIKEHIAVDRSYQEGEFEVKFKKTDWRVSTYAPVKIKAAEYSIEMNARFLKGAKGFVGLLFNDKGNDGCIFATMPEDQYYSFWKFLGGQTYIMKNWTKSSYINRAKKDNHLKAVLKGNKAYLYANGHLLFSCDCENGIDEYEVGFYVSGDNSWPSVVRVDNFKVVIGGE